jgi:hypothetical protein
MISVFIFSCLSTYLTQSKLAVFQESFKLIQIPKVKK